MNSDFFLFFFSNTRNCRFFDCECFFKYPELPVLWLWMFFQIPGTAGSLILNVFFNTRNCRFFDSECFFLFFTYPGTEGSFVLIVSSTRNQWVLQNSNTRPQDLVLERNYRHTYFLQGKKFTSIGRLGLYWNQLKKKKIKYFSQSIF
jgi:hypothetical protein